MITKYVIKAWQSSYMRNEGIYGLTLLHRSCPIPFLRNNERDLAVVPEVQKRNNNSLQGAWFWDSGAQQLACQTCGIFMKIQCNDLWYRRNLTTEIGVLPQKEIFVEIFVFAIKVTFAEISFVTHNLSIEILAIFL